MYLMYVDECGDTGMGQGASEFFILSGMVVHESMWTSFLTASAQAISDIKRRYGMDQKAEIHAKDMLGRVRKPYSLMKKLDRLMLFRDLLKFEGTLVSCIRIINVCIDKRGKPSTYDPFQHAWDALVNRFENTIQHGNFPIVAPGATPAYPEHGLLIVDQTDEKKLRVLVRQMRHNNMIPSGIVPGTTIQNNLHWVVEDAMHKDSKHSIPIQLCDANAYFLRQMKEPNSTIRKYGAKNYFYYLDPVLLKVASKNDPLGIVCL